MCEVAPPFSASVLRHLPHRNDGLIQYQGAVPCDYHLRVPGNDYCIDPTVIGRLADVRADLDTVKC
jgi:hypothetical protein